VEDLVDFTGQVDEVEKARQIARAWVLALPSLKEGWGLVILEAASRGVPAVAYAEAGGVTESIVHGDTGLLVDGGEPELAAALGELLADDERRWAMGSRARAHAERFSWDASAETFMRVLDRAVQAHHPRDHATGQSGYWVEP
jgi:glycosyltransferase involved in cell wall biosynthesis